MRHNSPHHYGKRDVVWSLQQSLVRRCNTPTNHSHEPSLHAHVHSTSTCEDNHVFFKLLLCNAFVMKNNQTENKRISKLSK